MLGIIGGSSLLESSLFKESTEKYDQTKLACFGASPLILIGAGGRSRDSS